MSLNREKVNNLFDSRAKDLTGVNSVLSSSNDIATTKKNIYRDYITKRAIIKYLDLKKSDVILDFGCGIGRISSIAAPHVAQVYGVDASGEMINKAKIDAPVNAHYFKSEGSLEMFEDKKFTKIYCCWVLQHLSDDELFAYLKEFSRTLVPSGIVVLLEQVRVKKVEIDEVVIHRTKNEYSEMFSKHGFELIKNAKTFRQPSYAMSIWYKYNLPKVFLPLLGVLEKLTLNRKMEFVEYYSEIIIFKKVGKAPISK